MKKTIIKGFSIFMAITIIIIGIVILIDYLDYRQQVVKDDSSEIVVDYLSDIKNQEGIIILRDYIDFQCDGFYIIGPYMTTEERKEIVGDNWNNDSSYGDHIINELLFKGDNINEGQQILVFVFEGQPVSSAIVERSIGDLLNYEELYYDIDEVLYNTIGSNGSNYWVINRN